MKLSKLAEILNGKLLGNDLDYFHLSTDSRNLSQGDLFVAIVGEKYNGHDFLGSAKKNGAIAAVVSKVQSIDLPQVHVKDTTIAFGQIAAHHRQAFQLPMIAVTGSCGKTTTRALLNQVFSQQANVLSSEKSFNNHIGVPLTLLRLNDSHRFGIFELGANHIGEIEYLAGLVKPDIAIITNAGKAHIEGFGSQGGVAKGKGEIYQSLSESGTAIVNNDDAYSEYWKTLIGHRRTITFGIAVQADVMATNIEIDQQAKTHFTLSIRDKEITVALPLLGQHNVYNALAAAATAYACDLPMLLIKQGLEQVLPVSGRLVEQQGYAGISVIDDSYNANPTSVSAAIDVLAHRRGERFLVLGDMLELGTNSQQFHYQIGEYAQQAGITRLYCLGDMSRYTVAGFGENAHFFASHKALFDSLKEDCHDQATVLVKGSLAMEMSQIAQGLVEEK